MQSNSYSEFDLTKFKNLNGGFLVAQEEEEKSQEKQEINQVPQDPPIIYPIELNQHCSFCDSVELDFNLLRQFEFAVCYTCKGKNPDQFSLITKTRAKNDYLLTDGELRDPSIKFITKPNPHKSSWSNMQLYLVHQIESFALKKWPSKEAIEDEKKSREDALMKKKEKRFNNSLSGKENIILVNSALRKRTRTEEWQRKHETVRIHDHDFEPCGPGEKKCKECGITIEFEEI